MIWFSGWQKHTEYTESWLTFALEVGMLVGTEEFSVLNFCLESTKQIHCKVLYGIEVLEEKQEK